MSNEIWTETWTEAWEELREGMKEGASDMLYLWVDIIAAPFMAICRVASDFIHGEGHYKHPDRGSRRVN
ncbi:MAG: hypothetical protein KGO22_22240 [Gammaproteobacteria bacterium]|nr:hypothetical protein [Gammaproteobacteria bacterium]